MCTSVIDTGPFLPLSDSLVMRCVSPERRMVSDINCDSDQCLIKTITRNYKRTEHQIYKITTIYGITTVGHQMSMDENSNTFARQIL